MKAPCQNSSQVPFIGCSLHGVARNKRMTLEVNSESVIFHHVRESQVIPRHGKVIVF